MVATRVMLGWAALVLGLPTGLAAAAPRPNFVVILVDDLGYGDIGPFGSTLNRTPHLDRMAAEGMKLTSFYVAPVCTASRAQLLTGCYAKRVSLDGVLMPRDSKGLHPEERTVAELLDADGYATMCIGKWHLGAGPDFMPRRHGFDRFLGLPYSNDMKGLQLFRDEQVVRAVGGAKDQADLTEAYTAEAIRFIDEHHDRPFFLYLAHTAVHVPLAPGAAFAGRSGNGRFGDWVEEVDASTGRILEALRRQGLDRHTLVLFMSDNGPWLDRGAGNSGVAGPLRGGKFSTWEGGVRSPTLAWWPGRIPPGTVSDAVMGEIDVLPTLVGLAGATVPDDRKIDGRDVWPVLSGATEKSPHEAYFLFSAATLHAVRSGPWKLAIAPQRDGRSKDAIDASLARPRLYDLSDDIGETTSVAADHPDVVERLVGHARAMDADLGIATSGPGVRPAGRSTGQPTPPAERKAGAGTERAVPAEGD